MATVIQSNLYPPVINTQANAIPVTIKKNTDDINYKTFTATNLYYSISDFNSINDFITDTESSNYNYGLQFKLTDSITGLSYSGFQNTHLNTDMNNPRQGQIVLTPAIINKIYSSGGTGGLGKEFFVDRKYRLQVRLVSKNASNINISSTSELKDQEDWINANLNYFTEWSSVCLFTFIYQPTLTITGIQNNKVSYEDLINLRGSLSFADTENDKESDFLTGQKVQLEDKKTGDILIQDENLNYPKEQGSNKFEYYIRNSLEENQEYRLKIDYNTNFYYSGTSEYNITINAAAATTAARIDEKVIPRNDVGSLLLNIEFNGDTQIILRRSSAEEGFKYWDDIALLTEADLKEYSVTCSTFDSVMGININNSGYAYLDTTVKSGVLYKYAVQKIDNNGNRCQQIGEAKGFALFDDAFLITKDKVLTLKFDINFTGYQRTKNESKTETIGNKYPFIRRNGNIDYRQITLNGLLSISADENEMFYTQEELKSLSFGLDNEYYDEYIQKYKITQNNDIILERNYREKVLDFLQNNSAKLFKSTPEGNMIVKLMDVKLTPKEELGRMLYSFSCSAYEIADDTVSNYRKYNILNRIKGETF